MKTIKSIRYRKDGKLVVFNVADEQTLKDITAAAEAFLTLIKDKNKRMDLKAALKEASCSQTRSSST